MVLVLEKNPLRYRTPLAWAKQVLQDPLALLSDHAYLERKAASNVLELFNRWPEPSGRGGATKWSITLAGIARDEARHLEQVLRLLAKRGGELQRLHKNPYANDLRCLVRAGQDRKELLDRLLVSALIELRSCERFELLAQACTERELGRFYKTLAASEAGHYAVFLELAEGVRPAGEVAVRWGEMLDAEARIIQAQASGPRIHSSVDRTEAGMIG